MNVNVNWLIEAAVVARAEWDGTARVHIELSFNDRGVRVDGWAGDYQHGYMVPWSDLTDCKFNPVLPAIEATAASLRRAIAAAGASDAV